MLPKLLTVILILGIYLSSRGVAASAENDGKVQSVEVQLIVSGKIYEGLQDRIEFSIGRVGEKILLSQPISLLQRNKEAVKAAIFNVFSKVLTGFKLDSVDLSLGEHTKVIIQMTPIAPLITKVRLHLEIKELAPEISEFTEELRLKIEDEFNQILVGLPVASASWSEGSINLVANYLIEREFPGYSGRFVMTAASETEFNLVLVPQELIINDVRVHYTSANFPIGLLHSKMKSFPSHFQILKGLPVEFVSHYQTKLEKLLTRYLNKESGIQQWGLSASLSLKPDVQTIVRLDFDSHIFQSQIEANYFMSSDNSFGYIYGYLGYHTEEYQLFARKYWGAYPGGDLKVGLRFPMASNLTGAFEYDPYNQYKDFWFHFQFERGDYLDLNLGLEHSPNEALVGILLNNNTNLEFVKFDKLFGVQLTFHL